ncbi:MAG: ABC transporter substrate-binding protein [Bradyrhizobiaceae bacterium]|nr:ABC transporter substrate-binding protein [Bradyrhizobiaceae bacterium]
MNRRKFLKGSAAAIGAATLPTVSAQAQAGPDKIRVGYAITQSGPLGPGAESTVVSQYKLWNKRVNDAGGIALKKFGKKVPIEMVSYDDQGKPDELIKLVERLIQQDKVDMILSPYATHMNLAAAPIVNKYQYPVIMTTSTTTKTYDLSKRLPYAFWQIVQPNEATQPLANYIGELKKQGKLKGTVAIVHPTIEYGVEMHEAFQNAAKKAGIDVVFSKSYPFGASDLQPVIREAMAKNPEVFVAMSYPPDTFMLTEQMQVVGFNPQIMYVAIGGVFPTYKGKFGDKVNGILAYGGQDKAVPGYAEYIKAHQEFHKRDSEAGAVSVYAALEATQQAIETVGEIDRPKIRDVLASATFKTLWGEYKYVDQRCSSPWAIGQWQNGELVGVFPADKQGAKPVLFPKPKWS